MALPFAAAIERLNPRERLLLSLMAAVLGTFLVFLVLLGVSSSLDDIQEDNEAHSAVLREIARNRTKFRDAERAGRELDRRYATKAPALQSFLEEKATKRGLEIRDAQDKPDVQHGKMFVERSVQIRLNKVEIRSFVQLMEDISTSRHPMAVSKLRVRRRLGETNSFDVDMTVSAYDRIGGPTKTKTVRPARPGLHPAGRSTAPGQGP